MRPGRPTNRGPDIPTGFKIWMAFCGVLGVGLLVVIVWAIIAFVTWVTSR